MIKEFLKPNKGKIFFFVLISIISFFISIDILKESGPEFLFLLFSGPIYLIQGINCLFEGCALLFDSVLYLISSIVIFLFWYIIICLVFWISNKFKKYQRFLIIILPLIITIGVYIFLQQWQRWEHQRREEERMQIYKESLEICKNRIPAPDCEIYCNNPCYESSPPDCCTPPVGKLCICTPFNQ